MQDYIFIPGNMPSSKNSKIWTGKRLISSKQVSRYVKASENYWKANKEKFLSMVEGKDKPYKISFFFIRDSKRRFDLVNVAQLPLDLMQSYGWIEDDSAYHVIPVFEGFSIDKQNAGVIIKVLL